MVHVHPFAKTVIEDLTNSLKKNKVDQDLQEAEDFILSDLHRHDDDDHDNEDIDDSDEDYEDKKNVKKVKLDEDWDNPDKEFQCYYCGTMVKGMIFLTRRRILGYFVFEHQRA